MKKYKIKGNGSKSLLDILRDNKINIAADCGGRGTCGKCKVYVNGKEALACKTFVKEDIEVEIPRESSLDNLWVEGARGSLRKEAFSHKPSVDKYNMAVDIGTTTVAAMLLDSNGNVINTAGTTNSQKAFGADVISRVKEASKDNLGLLKSAIREDIDLLKKRLSYMSGIQEEDIEKVIISANAVMEHLFMGYSCEGFEKAPYCCQTLEEISEGKFELIPCISPFVGADILSGIAVTEMDKKEKITALVDLGTNGEMALGNREKIFVASTAAGPVFEGGNITSGMSAMAGAINKVDISAYKVFYKTIEDEKPLGICAAGLIEAIWAMKKNKIVDQNGILMEEFHEDGFYIDEDIYITQEDINNFLMAKSAISSGINVLCKKMGIKPDSIDELYIAGGLGSNINIEAACQVGLIPKELREKSVQVGNTSLKGAAMRCQGQLSADRTSRIKDLCSEVVLADEDEFQRLYIEGLKL